MKDDRYLICQVERFSIAIVADDVNHIEEAPPSTGRSELYFDGRVLLDVPSAQPGVVVVLNLRAGEGALIVDAVQGIARIAESEFVPLPSVFEQANLLFDGACVTPIDGRHPLRLRHQSLGADAVAPTPL
jgi:hypothetical protein